LGDIGEFALKHRLFLKTYRWRRIDPVPSTPLSKPLRECRVAIVSSAGFLLPSQEPFDIEMRQGDPSFREIHADTDVSILVDMHRSETFDHAGMRDDPNLAFPIDRVRELAARGRIGSVNRRHLSFMGGITAPGRLVKYTAPEAARQLVHDAVDAALLIPV
jgi:D-proline reductase (dithiol) PrdB